jgi:hypothetical protein
MAGFELRETLSGAYTLDERPHDARAIALTITARVRSVGELVRGAFDIQGMLDAEHLASRRDIRGSLIVTPAAEHVIAYDLAFLCDRGARYRLHGHRALSRNRMLPGLSTLHATISTEDGTRVARGRLRFDFRSDWVRLLRSFRVL